MTSPRVTDALSTALSAVRMHADEFDVNASLVRRLLTAQFPHWAHLPISPVPSSGTDNALYRLGDEMVVRLPRIHWAVGQVEKAQVWLPRLAPHLPLHIPRPLAKGMPGEGYPWPWSIYRWLKGENAANGRIGDPCQLAVDLSQFVAALREIDPSGGPPPGEHNSGRGVPLSARDARVRESISSLNGSIDNIAVTAAWDAALRAPCWDGPKLWLHGDIQAGNLLCVDGRLNAVIDFGCLGVGDPACDLIVAWNLFSAESRQVFRETLQVDEEMWARGRGWALSVALIALPYYLDSNPVMVEASRRTINEVLNES